jgi:hypothetical protein
MDDPNTAQAELSVEQLHAEIASYKAQLEQSSKALDAANIRASVLSAKLQEVEQANIDIRVTATTINIELQQLKQLLQVKQPEPELVKTNKKRQTKGQLKAGTAT